MLVHGHGKLHINETSNKRQYKVTIGTSQPTLAWIL
jgi:hypothetical protein